MSFTDYLSQQWPQIVAMITQQAEVVLIAVAIAAITGIGQVRLNVCGVTWARMGGSSR